MQTHPLLVTLPDTIPSWIAGKPAKAVLEVVNTACQQAGVTGPAQFRFIVDPKGLTQRMPPCSLMLRPTAPYNRPDLVAFVACAQSPTQHRVHCTLTLPAPQRDTFARFIQSQDNGIYVLNAFRNPVLPPDLPLPPSVSTTDTPVCRPAPPPASAAPEFDDDTLALFLDAVRDAGITVTKATAESISRKLTGDTTLVTAALQAEYLAAYNTSHANLYSITIAGDTLLRQKIDAPADDATKPKDQPAPSEFDRLKAALIDARSQHQAAKAKHDDRAQALTTLTHQLTEAREAYQSEELNATTLQTRLQKLQQDLNSAQCKVTGARRHVLDLEERARALGTDTPDLIQAERTLKEAEAACIGRLLRLPHVLVQPHRCTGLFHRQAERDPFPARYFQSRRVPHP